MPYRAPRTRQRADRQSPDGAAVVVALGLGLGGLYAFGGPYAYCDPYDPYAYTYGYCGSYAYIW